MAVTEVLLNRKSKTLIVGQTLQLAATVYPDKATNKAVTWSTSNVSIAVVDNNGLVTARGAGKATITVTATNGTETADDDKTATCVVTVKTADTVETTVDVGDADTLKKALADAGIDVINITEDITLDGFEIPRSVTIDLNGHTLTAITILVADGDLTVRNGGQLISSLVNDDSESTLTLEGAEVTANPYQSSKDHDGYKGCALFWNGAIVLRNSRMTVNAWTIDKAPPNMWGVPADGKMLDLDDRSWLKIGTIDTSQVPGFDGMWLLLTSGARGNEGKDYNALTADYRARLGDFFPDGHTLYAFGGEGIYLFVKPGEGQEAPTSITLKKKVMTSPTAKTGLIYNGKPQALLDEAGAANFGTLLYSLDEKTYSTDIPVGTDAGNYAVWYLVSGDAGYSNSEPQSLDVAIARADATVTAENKSKTYGAVDPALSAKVTGLVNGESASVITYDLSRTKGENVSTYAITPSGDAEQGNYTVTFNPGTLTINRANATVTANVQTKTYGEDDPTLTAKVEGLVNGDNASVITYDLSRTKGENVSTYAITPSGAAEQGNYTVTFKPGKLTINRANATVMADNKSKTSGEADPALTATVSGLVNGDSASVIKYDLSRAVGEAVGEYAITPTGAAEQGNYTVAFKPGTLTITEATKPDDPSGELTPEQEKAVEEAKDDLKKDSEEKAKEAEKAAGDVDTSSESGQALADLLNGNVEGSEPEEKQATQAAALEVKEELEKSGLDVSDLTADEVKSAVENKKQEREDAAFEKAIDKVKDTTVPAATDLLAKSDNAALKDAGADLSVQPKVVTPEVLSATSRDQAVANIDKAAKNNDVPEGVDLEAVKAAAQPGALLSSKDITIEPASDDLKAQAEAVEKVFNLLSADLAGANEGKGVVIAVVLPKITPMLDGFYPLRVNHRHLIHGQQLRFWPSVSYFQQHAAGTASVADATSGKLGQYFFLDQNNVPTTTVSGDASKMVVVACLKGGESYDSAFITVDATEKDQETLKDLKEKATGNPNAPTSDKGSGGCDAGLGFAGLAALLGLARRRK